MRREFCLESDIWWLMKCFSFSGFSELKNIFWNYCWHFKCYIIDINAYAATNHWSNWQLCSENLWKIPENLVQLLKCLLCLWFVQANTFNHDMMDWEWKFIVTFLKFNELGMEILYAKLAISVEGISCLFLIWQLITSSIGMLLISYHRTCVNFFRDVHGILFVIIAKKIVKKLVNWS